MANIEYEDYLAHHGVKGQKWVFVVTRMRVAR